jgi:hypothetical protein
MEKSISDLEFVEYFANSLKSDNRLFEIQKTLLENHLNFTNNYFKNKFGDKNFKENARKYLKKVGLIN